MGGGGGGEVEICVCMHGLMCYTKVASLNDLFGVRAIAPHFSVDNYWFGSQDDPF